MTDSIDIFNDVIQILDAIVAMEKSIGTATKAGETFIKDFKAGNLDQAKLDCDELSGSLGDLEKIFKEKMLEPSMDLYQKIKDLLHIHIGNAEKQLLAFEQQAALKEAKKVLEQIKEKKNAL